MAFRWGISGLRFRGDRTVSWYQWIMAVLIIARDNGIIVTVTYPAMGWATFNWVCADGSRYGSAGAGWEFIHLTSPEAFTLFWRCGHGPVIDYPVPSEPWLRHGRFIPRVPAMAVSAALKELFQS